MATSSFLILDLATSKTFAAVHGFSSFLTNALDIQVYMEAY